MRAPSSSGAPGNGLVQNDLLVPGHSSIHGQGLFANAYIPRGTLILEYRGELIDKQESVRRCEQNNVYIFSLNDQHDIDGNVHWNPARLVNHSCRPNCEALLEDNRIWFMAMRDIRAGEELTFNYGFDLTDYRDYPCRCGSPDCVGFIVAEEFFDEVRKRAESPDAPGRPT